MSTNLGVRTNWKLPAAEESSTLFKLMNAVLMIGSSSWQATFPTGKVSWLIPHVPFFDLVAQNSGVSTSAAFSDTG
jgi:hypothetical protein